MSPVHTPLAKESSKKRKQNDASDETSNSFINQAVSLFASVAPWLVVGELSSALLAPYLNGYLQNTASKLLLFVLILPIQLCEHAAAALVRSINDTFSHGVGAVVLILAPAMNVATMSFLHSTLGVNPLLISVVLIVWAMIASSLIDALVGPTLLAEQAMTADEIQFPLAVQYASEFIVLVLALLAIKRNFHRVFFGVL